MENNLEHKRHLNRHKKLHKNLDELVADWISITGRLPSKATVMEFLEWSATQTKNPSKA